jgi:hypothetical protein
MRFYLGETYEGDFPSGSRRAIVTRLDDGGRRARLRFFDSNEEFAALFVELMQAGKWRRVAEAAN